MSGRDDNGFKKNMSAMKSKKRRGYGRNLFRNKRDGKIAGVCAGLADHLNMDHWIMRVIFIALFFVVGPLMFWAYLAGIILIAKRPAAWEPEREYDEERQSYREKTVFKHAKPAPERLRLAREKMDATLRRIEEMERYVTSSRYDLDRAFAEMEKGGS
ncbi:PspC domain-containing protein [Halioxenophilus sp. WMMB6]|uniref:PspC domain-containing protein n=1 Tax=Halioxenophilus sp. WMMB6 TaxID=3073815 RepID=UPI00295F34A5|nr:PspC domain-containing protein [Halioxenophilus sp. WMMB6]